MKSELKFIDLFAGIGGFRLGLSKLGLKCVFSAEIDDHAVQMYNDNYGVDARHDVTKMTDDEIRAIPDFDILTGGFPCQSFSISGKKQGFLDKTRGTLFFEILRFLTIKKPEAFILENVKNLLYHDHGNTFTVMMDSLNDLGYTVNYKLLNAKDFGVPQNRERIFIVGNLKGKNVDFSKLETNEVNSMLPFLDVDNNEEDYLDKSEYTLIPEQYVKKQSSGLKFVGYRNKKLRTKGVREGTEYLSRVHKMPNRIYSSDGVNPTFSSQEKSGRYFILLPDNRVRKLTINEMFRFMGFPDDFKKSGPKGKLYERIGNSVPVPMVSAVGKILLQTLSGDIDMSNPVDLMEFYFKVASSEEKSKYIDKLNKDQKEYAEIIADNEKSYKGVYTVLFTSLVYKIIHPEQDVRRHQKSIPGGYSGRSFDTKYVTPFLKQKRFSGAMKESGWLTRSLEQPIPYDLEFPGKINKKLVKEAFLSILNDVEEFGVSPENYLVAIINESLINKAKDSVEVINPVDKESNIEISEIMALLKKHFYYKNYKNGRRGSSILPVIAMYSIYQSLVKEMSRYEGKYLNTRESHYSSDKSSGETGDIVVKYKNTNEIYEVVDVKFDIPINKIMMADAFKKFRASNTIQRYYILSTIPISDEDLVEFNKYSKEIFDTQGTQLITNGLLKTINYYLRLIKDTNKFLDNYTNNLKVDPELNREHKISWNLIVKEYFDNRNN